MSNAVPAGWSDGTLTDFCDINPRLAQRAEMNADTPVSFIKMEDVSNNAVVRNVRVAPYGQVSKGFTSFQNGDVLVAKITPCFENGKGGFVQGLRNGVGFGSTEFHVLRARKDSNSEFLYQFTNSEDFRLKGEANMTGSAGQRRVPTEYLKTLDVIFPPLPEQQKIASILSSVDDVIEKTRAQIDKLKDLKTGMMQELLTKGIGHTEFKPLPGWRVGRIANLKSVPASWELVDILSVAKLESGHTPSRDNDIYWGGEIQWLSLHDTKNLINPIINTTVYSVTQQGIDNSSARILPKGTVALSRTASVGNCVMLGQDMATSQDFANYICGERLHPKYLLQLFRWMQHVWSNLSEGSTHKTIYMPVFKRLQILLPPYAEQQKIADAADNVDAAIAAKGEKLAIVKNLKKALMQDLLTGKVRVKIGEKETAVA